MVVSEIMTRGVKTVAPGTTLRKAARIMASEDCGALPVAHNEQLIGMLTDRDITVRAVAQGKHPDECTVIEAMTREVLYMFADETTEDLVRIMRSSCKSLTIREMLDEQSEHRSSLPRVDHRNAGCFKICDVARYDRHPMDKSRCRNDRVSL
jgi:CBS domain-containing protein